MKILIVVVSLLFVNCEAWALDPLADVRYCGEPARNADGSIKRSKKVIRAFEKLYPLPVDYNRDDWQIDHVLPLAEGGCDAVYNMQWLPKSIKTCAAASCKDRWERNGIYEGPR